MRVAIAIRSQRIKILGLSIHPSDVTIQHTTTVLFQHQGGTRTASGIRRQVVGVSTYHEGQRFLRN